MRKTLIMSLPISTIRNIQTILENIVENESHKQDWIETVRDEGFDYGKNSLYYTAKQSLLLVNETKNINWVNNYNHSEINFEEIMKQEYSKGENE